MAWDIMPGDATSRYSPDVDMPFVDLSTGERPKRWETDRMYWKQLCEGHPLRGRLLVPEEITLVQPRKQLPAVWAVLQQFCGQQLFVDLVEEFEPGVHEWFPVHFRSAQTGEPYPEQFFILNICQRLESVVLDHPSVRTETFESGRTVWTQKTGDVPIVFHKQVVEGHHIWRDEGAPYWIFASDALVEAMEARFPEGWRKQKRRLEEI